MYGLASDTTIHSDLGAYKFDVFASRSFTEETIDLCHVLWSCSELRRGYQGIRSCVMSRDFVAKIIVFQFFKLPEHFQHHRARNFVEGKVYNFW